MVAKRNPVTLRLSWSKLLQGCCSMMVSQVGRGRWSAVCRINERGDITIKSQGYECVTTNRCEQQLSIPTLFWEFSLVGADQFQYWWRSGGHWGPISSTHLVRSVLHPWLHSQNWFTRKMCRKPPWLGDVEIKKRWFTVNLGCLKLHIWLCETPTAPTSSDCCLVSIP